ncbi:PREDICTED: dual specificity protein kinase shkE-like [Amphimedon queenslandica]|nr:PREDICTED: dual specificity protein kinase shkE-like [Amphimedon queenslandica]|eukprot:XP_019860773.1 PREDICTED: dual specificity protein kinase shkE-like [Amphimedon queenslandica]
MELEEERREKEQVRNRLQQQLQGRERQLQQAQQQGQERERHAREREQDLQRQLQEKERQLQQAQQQLQSRERESQESQQQLQRQVEGGQQKEQDLQRQLQEREQQLEEREREFQERERQLEEQIQVAESSWVVNRREITMTEVVLGKGGWGEVKVAGFRGLKVAAKCLYEVIISPYNIGTFSREMNIASKIRHPNLLQFIEATTEGNPIILTELMLTSLRKELESGGVAYPAILSISLDVACALNYLHLFKPHPILHRDVSSANVLLQYVGNSWRAKVSDYGTVSLQPLTKTSNPGNPVYSAPESPYPNQHSPAMDVFSYGVLLIEMVVCEFPDVGKRVAQIKAIKRLALKNLIERCLMQNYKDRPTMSDIIKELNESI